MSAASHPITPRWEWRAFGSDFGTADARSVRTLAIESEDAGRVIAAVREMGLSGLANRSYPRGLRALLGMEG